jgi:threonylcarbamoyladenosine tRNA methylthiotransferase MtaB
MSTANKIAFHTLGCKLNFSETSSMANQAIDAGYQRVEVDEQADIYVVNTCSVTENADKECRYIVRKIKRLAPESKVIILGCYAQLKPKEISEI